MALSRDVAPNATSKEVVKMLRSEYYLARAERMRMLMLTSADGAAADRLRGFVLKYRALADRAKTQERPPSSAPQLVVSNAA
jgi:hypothetical protein